MTSESRAFVAWVSGQLVQQRTTESISEASDGERFFFADGAGNASPTRPAAERACGVRRDGAASNYCLRDPQGGEHICLSLYGRLLEGFAHGSDSHFNGFVDDGAVTLYDFAESDYFTYRLAER